MTINEYVAKWDGRFATNDSFEIDEADLREFKNDTAQLIQSGASGTPPISELILPQPVIGDSLYLTNSAIWAARSSFNAVAAPMPGPNWRLVVDFQRTLTAASITDASPAGRSMLTAASASAQLGLLDVLDIKAGQEGDHPAFTRAYTPQGLLLYLLKKAVQPALVPVVQAPGAPTGVEVDDTSDTLSGFLVAGYPAVADYEVFGSPDFPGIVNASAAGADIQNGRIISRSLKGNVLVGSAGIRVAANGSRPAGAWMLNDKPFTGIITPPTPLPTGDTVKPDVYFTVPALGATLPPNSEVMLTVIANDNVGVQALNFTNGATGAAIGAGAKNGNTYTFPYTTGAAGPLSLVATATDAAGNSQSATVNVTVGSGTTAPAPSPALTAALAISVASILAGSSLTFEVTPGGGTAPYAYAVKATNNATGAVTVLGSSATGSFTPQAAGTYNIDATVTDSASKVAQAATRTVTVTAPQSVNQMPVASAGDAITITAPTSSVLLQGSASDPDPGDNLTYQWRQVTGPVSVIGIPATTLNVAVSSLTAVGTYQFGFQATDQKGGKSPESFVVVTVRPLPVVGQAPVIIIDGQSNALGVGDPAFFSTQLGLSLTPSPTREFQRVFIWNAGAGAFQKLKLGINQFGYGGSFGAEIGLAQRWEQENSTGNLYLIKHSQDGKPIQNWDYGTVGYNELVNNYIKAAYAWLTAQGLTPVERGWYWMQGESNAGDTTYKNRLQNLVSRLVADGALATSGTVRVIGKVRSDAVVADQDVQYVASDPLARLIDTAFYDMNTDNLHYSGRAQYLAGFTDVYNRIFGLSTNYPFPMDPNGTSLLPAGSGNTNAGGSAENIVEDSDSKIFYLGGITSFNSASNPGDSGTSRFKGGDTMIGFSVSGPNVSGWLRTYDESAIHIKFELWVNGVYRNTQDYKAAGNFAKQWDVTGMPAGTNTILLVSRAAWGNTLLYFDQVRVLGKLVDYVGPTTLPGAPSGSTPPPSSPYLGVANYQPDNGLPVIGPGMFDAVANPTYFKFTGTYAPYNNGFGLTYLWPNEGGGSVEFNIEGEYLDTIHEMLNHAVKYGVYVDKVFIETYFGAATYGERGLHYSSPRFVKGIHTIKIDFAAGDYWGMLALLRVRNA
jgi:hypothetical protein